MDPYESPGQWTVNTSFRTLRSTDHYNGDVEQVQRQTQGTYVINHQNMLDVSVSYNFTKRFALTGSVPYVVASWSIPSPTAPVPGPRAVQAANGLGDISVTSRMWLFDTATHKRRNLALGAGVKVPTGNAAAVDYFPDIRGSNPQNKAVDQSAQPGDGGWGVLLEGHGFSRVHERVLLFGSVNYLVNPKNTNGTPSVLVGLGVPITAATQNKAFNSVPDQYLVHVGSTVAIGGHFALSGAYRLEGMPRYDLIGRSDGFRRPGYEMFVEPGFSYTTGRHTVGLNIPIAVYRNRLPDPYTGAAGDATFPNVITLATYTYRFGGTSLVKPPAPDPTRPTTW